jgi:hypothetical protein
VNIVAAIREVAGMGNQTPGPAMEAVSSPQSGAAPDSPPADRKPDPETAR